MDFIKELCLIRNQKLAEIENETNKKSLNKFTEYLTKLFIDSQKGLFIAFKHYVTNNPTNKNPAIVKHYSISAEYVDGLYLFFNQEGGKNVKEFISSITETVYKGFHISIKNNTVENDYKIVARFEIHFEEFKGLEERV